MERALLDACLLDVMAHQAGKCGRARWQATAWRCSTSCVVRGWRPLLLPAMRRCVGERIYRAVAATRAAVGTNTNLGIVLLAAPLAHAARAGAAAAFPGLPERSARASPRRPDLGRCHLGIRGDLPGKSGRTGRRSPPRCAPTGYGELTGGDARGSRPG